MIDESEKLKSRTINDFLKDFPSTTRILLIIQYWTLEQGISSFEDDIHTLNSTSPLMIKQELDTMTHNIEPTPPISYTLKTSISTSKQQNNLLSSVSSPKRV